LPAQDIRIYEYPKLAIFSTATSESSESGFSITIQVIVRRAI